MMLVVPVLGCGKKKESAGSAVAGGANYQLVCDSSDTKDRSSLFCIRMDTRNGDIKVVAVDKIAVSQGPTASEARDPGTYQIECHATRNEQSSDLYCLRLNRASGEMLLVALPKVGTVPAAAD